MTAATESVIGDMVQAIAACCSPLKIILFGSRARGDARADSDVDLLIVESEPFGGGRSRAQEIARIRRALRDFPVPKDVLVYSLDEVEQSKNSRNHVLALGLREGKTLYARH